MTRIQICTALLTVIVSGQTSAASPLKTTVVADSTLGAPDGNGRLSQFIAPTLNDAGHVTFDALVSLTNAPDSDVDGIFRGDGVGTLVQIARAGQPSPDGNGVFSRSFTIFPQQQNGVGEVAFLRRISETTGGASDDRGIFRGDGLEELVQIARTGQTAPDGNGRFVDFDRPSLNDAGEAAFLGVLAGTNGGSSDHHGIFRGDGVGSLVQIARAGQVAPDGNGTFIGFPSVTVPSINDSGQVVFPVALAETLGGSSDNRILLRGDGVDAPVKIARAGQDAPDGNGIFSRFSFPAVNNAGQVVFEANLNGSAGGTSDNKGVFLGDGVNTPVQIVRTGQAAPDGNGRFSALFNAALNEAGQVALEGYLVGTSGGLDDSEGIFRGDGIDSPVQIARKGQAAPDGNGRFFSFLDPSLNNSGQLVFEASLAGSLGGSSDDEGIFLFDDRFGLMTVVREGDEFLGSTLTGLSFNGGNANEWSGLNNFGQIAFAYQLADGRRGIAITSVIPEPASFALLMVVVSIVLDRQQLHLLRRYISDGVRTGETRTA